MTISQVHTWISPGQTALTRTFWPVSSYAEVWAIDLTAALLAEYGVGPAFAKRPATAHQCSEINHVAKKKKPY